MSTDAWDIREEHTCPQMAAASFGVYKGRETEQFIGYGRFYDHGPHWALYDATNSHDVRQWPIAFCPFCGVKLEAQP